MEDFTSSHFVITRIQIQIDALKNINDDCIYVTFLYGAFSNVQVSWMQKIGRISLTFCYCVFQYVSSREEA